MNAGANGRGRLQLAVQVIGERPAGRTNQVRGWSSPRWRPRGQWRRLPSSPSLPPTPTSPWALGIPAVTIGAGGEAGLAHTLDEWYHNEGGPEGVLRALLTVLFTVGGE